MNGSTTGKIAATVGAAVVLPLGAAGTASAQPPDEIAQCESGGSYTAQNSSSSASGKWQMIDSTWQAYGGSTEHAWQASPAEQDRVAARLHAAEGTAPWNASKDCWGGTIGSASGDPDPAPAPREAREAPASPERPAGSGRAADGSGTYVCSTATLSFDACDPGDLGETVRYPLYDGHTAAPSRHAGGGYLVRAGDTLSGIAQAHGTTVHRLAELNGIADVDTIYAGSTLRTA